MLFILQVAIIFCALISNQLSSSATSVAIPKNEFIIMGLFGVHPQALSVTIENFRLVKSPENFGVILPNWTNRLALFGPPGNGKTTLAQEIAKLTDSKFIKVSASNFVTRYQGSGSEAVKALFKDAIRLTDQGESVVLFIDEVDAIVSKSTPSNQHDARSAMQTLWCEISEQEDNNNLLIIVATNVRENFHEAFDSRFPASCALEIENPTADNRRDIIKKSFMLGRMPKFNEKLIDRCGIEAGKKFREKQDVSFNNLFTLLTEIKKASLEFGTSGNCREKEGLVILVGEETKVSVKDKLHDLITTLRNMSVDFLSDSQSSLDLDTYQKKSFENFFAAINNYLVKLEKWSNEDHAYLSDADLNHYVEKTSGLSVRTILKFMQYVNSLERTSNSDGSVCMQTVLIDEHLRKIHADLRKNKMRWSDDDRQAAADLQAKHNLIQTYKDSVKKCLTWECIKTIRNNATYKKLRKELFMPEGSDECDTVTDVGSFAPGTVYVVISKDLEAIKNGTMLHGNQRLFIAPSGNGKRSLAKQYAVAGDGVFKEFDASEIIHGYINEGSGFFSYLISSILDESERVNKKLAVVYVSKCDQIVFSCGSEPVQYNFNYSKERAALEQFVLESGKYKDDKNQQLIFIFGAHEEGGCVSTIMEKLNGESWRLENNYQMRKEIFKHYFLANYEILTLKHKIITLGSTLQKNLSPLLKFYMQAVIEIENTNNEWQKADQSFWDEYEKYKKSGWGTSKSNLEKAQREAIKLSKNISQQHKELAEKWRLESSKISHRTEHSYCVYQYQQNKNLENFFLRHIKMYENIDECEKVYADNYRNSNRRVMLEAKKLSASEKYKIN